MMSFFNNYGNFILFILALVICACTAVCFFEIKKVRKELGAQKFSLKCLRCSEAKAEYFSFYVTNASLNDRVLSNFGIEVSGHHIDLGKLCRSDAQESKPSLIKQRNSLIFNLDVISVENEVFSVAERYGVSNVRLYAVDGMGTISSERTAELEKMLKKDFKAGRRSHRGFASRFKMPKKEAAEEESAGNSATAGTEGSLLPTVVEEPLPPTPTLGEKIRNVFKKNN